MNQIEHHNIEKLFPYRSPWIFIDRVLDWSPGTEIIVQKCVSASDPFISAHFFNGPRVVPGVLLIELVGQAAYLLSQLTTANSNHGGNNSAKTYVLGDCKAKFLSPALVGDVLVACVKLEATVRDMAVYNGIVTVEAREISRIRITGVPVDLDTWSVHT